MFCMPVLFPSLYVKDKDKLRNIISSAQRLGLESIADFDTLICKRKKSTALKLFHDDEHFINSIIEGCSSGRCRLSKTRTVRERTVFINIWQKPKMIVYFSFLQ